MTVTVILAGGDTDKYMRFGDTYVKQIDGTLDVCRTGAKTLTYSPGEWANVEGDQRRSGRRGFFFRR
jgi:hypothetical protein